ncbi:iron donor protein CyaY [Algicola sagamiensis]|uniref:iron donor protein CyaY n=1 Tax=Algicola sagamiensis TaxID=163869 RepID=UPI0003658FE7|nr:iron donor protein CyaY [Algicola sagamiensis]
MNDTEYHQLAEKTLLAIEEAVEALDIDLDYETTDGMLEVIFQNDTRIIINKQAPIHQIWVATKFNGHHFDWKDSQWIDNRSGMELWDLLDDAASKQSGQTVQLGRA